MCWKKIPYWLKGGIVAVLVLVASYLVLALSILLSLTSLNLFCGSGNSAAVYSPGILGDCNFLNNPWVYRVCIYGELLVIFFIIGIVISLILKKIKSRRISRKTRK